ncbi:uncharacterized protein E5676_scaffold282G00170 [Cucumis melo var. makuwa]|uniref:Ubiquitin-like protease family profile domain-containing protein n=1 Tax=Cucumis melo var. makuwa TaxID=1194695 RepID=A0A5D3B9B4_CUCMM|nr:uncharacterized protein E5676_scaffold282G00170 [Cucumis melo var. makuwa]
MEGAKNVNNLEDLSNDLESQKDVEDVVELNKDIKGTIIDSDVEGDNVKVVVDVVVDGDCAIPIPLEQGMYKMPQEVGSHILWPRDLVITDNIKMDYGEFTKDMTTFAPTPIQNASVALRFLLRMVEHMGCKGSEKARWFKRGLAARLEMQGSARLKGRRRLGLGRGRDSRMFGSRGVRLGYSAGATACGSTRKWATQVMREKRGSGQLRAIANLRTRGSHLRARATVCRGNAALGDSLQAERDARRRLTGGTRCSTTAYRRNVVLGGCFVWERGRDAIGSRDGAQRTTFRLGRLATHVRRLGDAKSGGSDGYYDQLLLIPYNFGNHWTLVVINLMKGAAFWIDPLKNRIDPDVTEVVERSFNIMNKKKPNWRVVKCPKKSRVVECGYYVMRFMRDIIMSRSTSIIQICVVDHEVLLKCVVDKKVLLKCVVDKKMLLKCVVHHEVLLKCVVDKKVLLKCVVDYEVLLKCFVDHEVLLKCYGCVLYWKEFADLQHCPTCGETWYKEESADMRWYKNKRVEIDDVLRHPVDVNGWKHFDCEFPNFAYDPWNVHLGLALDGFNPFGHMSTSYSM